MNDYSVGAHGHPGWFPGKYEESDMSKWIDVQAEQPQFTASMYGSAEAAKKAQAAAQPSGSAVGTADALKILGRLVTDWTAQAKDCREMAARLPNHPAHNELLRDAAQYDQSVYGIGLAIAALRAARGMK